MYTLRVTLAVVCTLAVTSMAYKIPLLYKKFYAPRLNPCTGSGSFEWLPHPTNCNKYFTCWGSSQMEHRCGPETSWQPYQKVCVYVGSDNDICYHTQRLLSSSPEKPHGILIGEPVPQSCGYGVVGVIPHPLNCAQYYDCSDSTEYSYWEKHLKECEYPLWFSSETRTCQHYSQVTCGSRVQAINPCDYQKNQCGSAHCIPCSARFPDCSGLPDGDNPWRGREETPQFCACQNGRVLRSDTCPEAQIFDSSSRKCVDQAHYFKYKTYGQ